MVLLMKAEQARKLLIEKKIERYSELVKDVYSNGMADFKIQRALAINKGSSRFVIYINPNNGYPYDDRYYQARTIIKLLQDIESFGYKVKPSGNGFDGGYYEISF